MYAALRDNPCCSDKSNIAFSFQQVTLFMGVRLHVLLMASFFATSTIDQ